MHDYLAAFRANPKRDLLQHGVKGMRWGVRKDSLKTTSFRVSNGPPPEKMSMTMDRDGNPAIVMDVKPASKSEIARVESSLGRSLESFESVHKITTQNREQFERQESARGAVRTARTMAFTAAVANRILSQDEMKVGEPVGEMMHHGVKGMRWGVRRSSSQLRAAAKARGDSPAKKTEEASKTSASSGGSGVKRPPGNIQDNVESSADRYARLSAQARSGKASDMTEQDLKFFNARTEALSKVEKMYKEDPSWLSATTKKVIQKTAENQMQAVSDALANKYIGKPISDAIKGTSK